MNYFEFYGGDYTRDTAHLSLSEHGAFLLLLTTYYSTEKPLPADLGAVQRIARAVTADEQLAAAKVAEEFFPVGEDGLRHNRRADDEIEKARKRIETARVNGRNGGRRPSGVAKSNPVGNPVGSNPVTQQQPDGQALHAPCSTLKAPQPPEGALFELSSTKPKAAKASITLATYLADCESQGAEAIPETDAVWTSAEAAGLPREFIPLAWWAFQGRYLGGKTRQASGAGWVQKFRNAVRENWFKLWWINGDAYQLTTTGMQVKREMEASA